MIAVDVEASGVDAEIHSIVSIGAVDTDEPTNQFYDECRVWEMAHPKGTSESRKFRAQISDESLAVNGFSREEVTDRQKKSEGELIQAFVAWACDRPKNRMLVAHNVLFDYSFIRAGCRRAKEDFPFATRSLDIHSLIWLHMQEKGVSQPVGEHHSLINFDFALRYCGLPEESKPHNALTGALSHAEVFSRIAYNKKLLPEFSSFDISWNPHQ